MTVENLLNASPRPFEAPDFGTWNDDDFIPAVKEGISRAKADIEKIKTNSEAPTFENTMEALEFAGEHLSRVQSIFYNLYSAHKSDAMEKIVQEIAPLTAAYANDISLDPILFERVDALYQQRETLGLTTEQMTMLENSWKGFVRNGAELEESDKERLREIDSQLAKLSPQFSDNVLAATNAFEMIIEDAADLEGLPETAIDAAAHSATENGHEGKWRFSLDYPSYAPFMDFAKNRDLREKMWRAMTSKAFEGDFSNQEILKQIVTLRHERAQLLGYGTHADYVLENRMAKDTKTVMGFIGRIIEKARPTAEKELAALQDFAKKDGIDPLKPWDIAFYTQKLQKQLFQFDEEDLRPYYKLENVIDGMFEHANKLYGLSFKKPEDDKYPAYHEDVKIYEVYDENGDFLSLFYLDLFPRNTKRGGAWMNTFRTQGIEDGISKRPIVVNVCNFPKSTETTPSLLSQRDVETLFHEFGHGLHGMLSNVTYQSMAGPNVKWDFVELPSQINEQWVYEPEVLATFARHYKTGEVMPTELIQKLNESKQFMSGSMTLRQMAFASLDMKWHTANPDDIDSVIDFERAAMDHCTLLPYEGGCFSSAFSHIFSGGYSAGYYSYMWAEVLDADAYEAFKENGLYHPDTAHKFRTLMAKGGSEDPMKLYVDFRGRRPSEDALLKRKGLASNDNKSDKKRASNSSP